MQKRKQVGMIALIIAMLTTGCSKSTIAQDAIDQGKLAMANMKYQEASNSFRLAIEEGSQDKQIIELSNSLQGYLSALQLFNENKYEEVITTLDELKVGEPDSFQKDIAALKEKAEDEIKKQEQELLEKLEAEKEKAENEIKKQEQELLEKLEAEKEEAERIAKELEEKEEKEKIDGLIDQIYELGYGRRGEHIIEHVESGFMVDDVVEDYYCFTISFDEFVQDYIMVADRETLEFFTYDPYRGILPLETYDQSPEESIESILSEEEAVELVYEVMKEDGYAYVKPAGYYLDDRAVYVVEGYGESKPDCMYTICPYTLKIERVY